MRAAAATIVLLAAGLLAGHALGDTVPVPTVPTVTLSTPTVTVPIPTIPTLPSPTLPATTTVQVPTSTSAAPTVSSVFSVAGSVSSVAGSAPGGVSSGNSSSSSSAGASSLGPRSERPSVGPYGSSRTWIATTGPKRRRVTTLTFVLPHAGRVLFVVTQVSPICRTVDRFAVRGHAGRNRIHFPRPASRLQLVPGTYLISARTRAGRLVSRVTLVVVDGGAPSRDEIAAARAANVCSAAGASNTGSIAYPQQMQRSFAPKRQSSAGGPSKGSNTPSSAVLGSVVERTARAVRPFLVALLAASILLLGLASLPKVAVAEPRLNYMLARHRVEIATVGAMALLAVAVAFLLG